MPLKMCNNVFEWPLLHGNHRDTCMNILKSWHTLVESAPLTGRSVGCSAQLVSWDCPLSVLQCQLLQTWHLPSLYCRLSAPLLCCSLVSAVLVAVSHARVAATALVSTWPRLQVTPPPLTTAPRSLVRYHSYCPLSFHWSRRQGGPLVSGGQWRDSGRTGGLACSGCAGLMHWSLVSRCLVLKGSNAVAADVG